jgi:hypothetical protein
MLWRYYSHVRKLPNGDASNVPPIHAANPALAIEHATSLFYEFFHPGKQGVAYHRLLPDIRLRQRRWCSHA